MKFLPFLILFLPGIANAGMAESQSGRVKVSTTLAPGSTNYIQNTNITQIPSSMNIVSGTVSGQALFALDSGKNVGIGKKVPSTKLDILGSIAEHGLRIQAGNVTASWYPLNVSNYGGTRSVVFRGDGSMGIYDVTPDAQFEILAPPGQSETAYMLAVSSQNDVVGNIFSVRNNGRVGIGVPSPTHNLEVASTTAINAGNLKILQRGEGVVYTDDNGIMWKSKANLDGTIHLDSYP